MVDEPSAVAAAVAVAALPVVVAVLASGVESAPGLPWVNHFSSMNPISQRPLSICNFRGISNAVDCFVKTF